MAVKKISIALLICTAALHAKKPTLPAPTPSMHQQITSHELSANAFSHIPDEKKAEPIQRIFTQDEKKADLDFCIEAVNNIGQEGFDPDAISPSGVTALQLLVLYYIHGIVDADKAIAQILKAGASVDIQAALDKTPLYFITAYTALTNENNLALEIQEPETINDETTDQTKHKESQKQESTRVLTIQSREKNLALLDTLLQYGANPLIADNEGITPLHMAIATQDMDILQLFATYEWIMIVDAPTDETTEESLEPTDTDNLATSLSA